MKYDWIDAYLMAKPGMEKDFKAEWNWQRYLLRGKMCVALCMDAFGRPSLITLKLDPLEGELLRKQYEDILPGYYMNKLHWNSVRADGSVPDELLRHMLDSSYQLILSSFGKKTQAEILTQGSAPV